MKNRSQALTFYFVRAPTACIIPPVPECLFHNRRVVQLENDSIRISITVEGGHIAELLDKRTGVNPLWIPPWPSIEVSSFSADDSTYGHTSESRLLAGIMGHNLCLDMFGPPSPQEEAAGLSAHGEAGVLPWSIEQDANELVTRCRLPEARLSFERRLALRGRGVLIQETVENLSALDRPIAWTQHVTLGPPFLERGTTLFRTSATRSRSMGEEKDFLWPFYPGAAGPEDLRVLTNAASSGKYTAHLLDSTAPTAWFWAWSPRSRVLIGYVWKRADFPWLGIWEENHSRTHAPWNGNTLTRGMEFGVSPFPETRRAMIDRGALFDTPCTRWIAARQRQTVVYYAAIGHADSIPEKLLEFIDTIGLPSDFGYEV